MFEIARLRDSTELNNDGMIKLGDVHYQPEPNLSMFLKLTVSSFFPAHGVGAVFPQYLPGYTKK